MRTTLLPAERLLSLLKRQKIATITELKNALGSNSSMTIFRKLQELKYITSCSHSGKYYTLKRIAKFNHMGLWSYDSVLFSSYGTLYDTLIGLVEQSEKGYTALEFEKLLNIKPNGPLLELTKVKKLCRKKIFGVFVYFSENNTIKRKQELIRKDCIQKIDRINLSPKVLMNELKAALIIFFSLLDEKQRRLYSGLESLRIGHGGDKHVAEIFGLNEKTVAKGRKELLEEIVEVDTVRKKGGGTKDKKKFQK